ncbi:Rne/Rng family ribonuclease [Rhodopila sp.]|uniref:Rne/Rng family ribonuclease n=1 Tax=Rhodopila sp. TaxID=2480087 RepID=UPI003D0E9D40
MTKRMLIDATHAEETRVVVLDGNRLEDFDVETSTKRQLKGNIYLAKVVRVEPSLQAAFVEYGGNRHGFLAFSEIHPDYYQIPVADRQRLIEMQAEEARREEEEADLELALMQSPDHHDAAEPAAPVVQDRMGEPGGEPKVEAWALPSLPLLMAPEPVVALEDAALAPDVWATPELPVPLAEQNNEPVETETGTASEDQSFEHSPEDDDTPFGSTEDAAGDLPPPEVMGGDHDSGDDQRERRLASRFMRSYKIQEVIRRRQILLVQVVKEERGTKGAALTTYLSLAGRFGVLMPNSPRGGGISRKITSAADRRRLKEVMAELDIPRGMGMIVRTAGANRPKPEIKRDCEYLLRLWDDIRDHTMKSVAPALIYEEASLIKRAIRDVYSRDIDEILVDGEDGWRAAHDFMRMLMPSHAKKVQMWRDGGQPLFARNQVEAQLDGMLMPTVQLRSGGYLVINQAEALVAIDVNSGRSTRERNVEETAVRTNLEAADEAARQLRLRDLAGLIVIDFIDMESKRHNAMVERRMKEALKNDRARIQVGHISHFGLLEMSRQRLRPSLAETSFIPCPHCGGTGHVRSTENAAIHVLRGIEDEGSKRRAAEIAVHVSTPVALYLLNHKRERLREIELRYVMKVIIAADDAQIAPQFRIDRLRVRSPDELPVVVAPDHMVMAPSVPEAEADPEEEDDVVVSEDEDDETDEDHQAQRADDARADDAGAVAGETSEEAEKRRRKRRRRRRGGRRDEAGTAIEARDEAPAAPPPAALPPAALPPAALPPAALAGPDEAVEETPAMAAAAPAEVAADSAPAAAEATPPQADVAPQTDTAPQTDDDRNRRRGRRGGRRRRRDGDADTSPFAIPGAEQPDLLPVYAGPTPADPFGGQAFDIFDVMDQAERQAEAAPPMRAASAVEIISISGPQPETAAPEAEPDAAEPAAGPVSRDITADSSAEILNATAPEPSAEPLMMEPEPQAEEPAAPTPANDVLAEIAMPEPPPAEPAVKPILVGADNEAPVEKKRGWWRR